MWIAVAWLNPTLAFLAVTVLPIPYIIEYNEDVLARMGYISAGYWLKFLGKYFFCFFLKRIL
jgi:hypothetical protein